MAGPAHRGRDPARPAARGRAAAAHRPGPGLVAPGRGGYRRPDRAARGPATPEPAAGSATAARSPGAGRAGRCQPLAAGAGHGAHIDCDGRARGGAEHHAQGTEGPAARMCPGWRVNHPRHGAHRGQGPGRRAARPGLSGGRWHRRPGALLETTGRCRSVGAAGGRHRGSKAARARAHRGPHHRGHRQG